MSKHLTTYLFALSKKYSCPVKGVLRAVWPCQLMLEYAKGNNVLETAFPQFQ